MNETNEETLSYDEVVELNEVLFGKVEHMLHYLLSGVIDNGSRIDEIHRLQRFMHNNGRMSDELR